METNHFESSQEHAPFVEAIFIIEAAGKPAQRVGSLEAIAGRGLRGDRYADGFGYYSKADPCEVTLIESEVLDLIHARYGLKVHEGQHRRNLVIRGLKLRELSGCQLRIGTTLLEYDRPRPPCAYVERLTEKGMTRALGEGAGIAVKVIKTGWLHEGDRIEIVHGAAPRRRRLP